MLRIPDVIGVRLTGRLQRGCLATDLALTVTERLRAHRRVGRVRRVLRPRRVHALGRRARRRRQHGARIRRHLPASSRSTSTRSTTCATPAATAAHVASSRPTPQRQGLWFDPEAEPALHRTIEIDLAEHRLSASPGRAGRRTGSRRRDRSRRSRRARDVPPRPTPIASMPRRSPSPSPRSRAAPTPPIRGCSSRPAWSPARRAGSGCRPPAWVKTSLAPGLAGRRALPGARRAAGGSRGASASASSATAARPASATPARCPRRSHEAIDGARHRSGRGAVRQPQLPRPRASATRTRLPQLAAAGGRLRARRRRRAATSSRDPIGRDADGRAVSLRDLWPTGDEIDAALAAAADPADFAARLRRSPRPATPVARARRAGHARCSRGTRARRYCAARLSRRSARAALLGPLRRASAARARRRHHHRPHLAGQRDPARQRGRRLPGRARREPRRPERLRVAPRQLGSHAARPVHQQAPCATCWRRGAPVAHTVHVASGEVLPLWDAAERYRDDGRLRRPGRGRALRHRVVARLGREGRSACSACAPCWPSSFERIHRSNLIGMGILPLRLPAGAASERICTCVQATGSIDADPDQHRSACTGRASPSTGASGKTRNLHAAAAVETALEVEILQRRRHHSPDPAARRSTRSARAASAAPDSPARRKRPAKLAVTSGASGNVRWRSPSDATIEGRSS